jgi:hypothetical protein
MFPDFLGIGAHKAGTTWLDVNLGEHPQIWMPPIKDVHFFDHPSSTLRKRLLGRKDYQRAARGQALQTFARFPRDRDWAALSWSLRYWLGARGDDWYQSLFAHRDGCVTGEVTPSYAPLSEDRIRHLHERIPTIKIIYLLRNPIDRAWSNAAMHLRKMPRNGSDRVSDDWIVAHLGRQKMIARADYLRNLQRWERHVGRDRIFVGFFDQLERDPAGLLKAVFEFLGVGSTAEFIPPTVGVKRNAGGPSGVPVRFRASLAKLHHQHIAALHGHLNNSYTKAWLDSATDFLATEPAGTEAAAGTS